MALLFEHLGRAHFLHSEFGQLFGFILRFLVFVLFLSELGRTLPTVVLRRLTHEHSCVDVIEQVDLIAPALHLFQVLIQPHASDWMTHPVEHDKVLVLEGSNLQTVKLVVAPGTLVDSALRPNLPHDAVSLVGHLSVRPLVLERTALSLDHSEALVHITRKLAIFDSCHRQIRPVRADLLDKHLVRFQIEPFELPPEADFLRASLARDFLHLAEGGLDGQIVREDFIVG